MPDKTALEETVLWLLGKLGLESCVEPHCEALVQPGAFDQQCLITESFCADGWMGERGKKPILLETVALSGEHLKHAMDGGEWWFRRIVNTLGGEICNPKPGTNLKCAWYSTLYGIIYL